MRALQQHLASILKEKASRGDRPVIIGVSGAYTAGKTLFSNNLAAFLTAQGNKTQLIHYDDFHHPFSVIQWTAENGDEIDAFYNRAFDDKKLIAEVLLPLKENGFIKKDIHCIDLGSGQFTKTLHFAIDKETMVIVEGVLLFRSSLLHYLDYKIFLDIPSDEILRRGATRDVPKFGLQILDKYRSRYIPVYNRHLTEDDPRERADMLIDNTNYFNPVVLRPAHWGIPLSSEI